MRPIWNAYEETTCGYIMEKKRINTRCHRVILIKFLEIRAVHRRLTTSRSMRKYKNYKNRNKSSPTDSLLLSNKLVKGQENEYYNVDVKNRLVSYLD